MKDAQYTVLARNRPIQVAFLINADSFSSRPEVLNDLMDGIVNWNNTHWGGRTNPIIFFTGASLSQDDWLQLEVADPDCISVTGPIKAELLNSLDEKLHPWSIEVNDKPEADGFKVPYEAEGIAVPPTPANLRRLQGAVSGIFGEEHKLLLFEFSEGCEPDLRRFIHRNFGTYHQWFDQHAKRVRRIAWLETLLPKIRTQAIPISDPASMAAALTQLSGRMRRGDMRPAMSFIAPYQLASLDLQVWGTSDFRHIYEVVIGDSAAEFAQFWNGMLPRQSWWRTHQCQLWVPTSLISNPAIFDALLDWLRLFTSYGSDGRRVQLSSQSLPPEELEKIRKTLYATDPPVPTDAPASATQDRARGVLEKEKERARGFIPWDGRSDTERLTGSNSTQRLSIPKPNLLSDELNPEGSWMADLQIEHISDFTNAPREQSWWRLPSRNSAAW